jgi:hypothetical protein
MPATWKHPELGRFTFHHGCWTQTVNAPGFKAFDYDPGYGNDPIPSGKIPLRIEAKNERDKPSAELITVAIAVLADPPGIIELITSALWNDFAGEGPHSGMWWHGQIKELTEEMPSLKSPADLCDLLRLYSIRIRKPDPGRPEAFIVNPFTKQKVKARPRPPVPAAAEFDFHAPFEEEHGVGILTDGKSVFGVGYSSDVGPYRSE